MCNENAIAMKPIGDDPDWIAGVDDLLDLDDLDDLETPRTLPKRQDPPKPHGLLWDECARCHRNRTLEEMPADGADERKWRCRACGEVMPHTEVYGYQDDVMMNISNMPDCPPIVKSAMSWSGELLLGVSRGERVDPVVAGNVSRLLLRLLEEYGAEQEEWHDRADK